MLKEKSGSTSINVATSSSPSRDFISWGLSLSEPIFVGSNLSFFISIWSIKLEKLMSSFFIWDGVDDIWLLFLSLSKFNESNEVNNREINDIIKVVFLL